MEEIGFLGLGIMGKAMSMNLLRHGFKVTVWNRTLSRCDELVKHGATIGETPAAVIKKCKYTIAMLSDPAAALSVVFDQHGVLEQICSGKGYIDMSTVDAETSSKISEAITAKGGHFLEAPVSGSKKPAEDGQLVILAAGDKEITALYFCIVSMMNAFSEGLVLADKSGLNPQTLLDVLQKDMRLALALGDESSVPMPVAAAANEAFKKARSMGLGDLDFSAVHETVQSSKGSS
ncbi:UNVERIFIED_CONTAM: Glyoxylate/succinic semialdehyde reductase 1 [Sesamum angustifolium]|uniref:Glyoxylate/succinic semialdehyde reductase 1 n=1 Tax=Sesamum angustifolium TaxID=2727405 RepID=A0AAW2QSS5_9LAMI